MNTSVNDRIEEGARLLEQYYPSVRAIIPPRGDAIRAWTGYIQPFPKGPDARVLSNLFHGSGALIGTNGSLYVAAMKEEKLFGVEILSRLQRMDTTFRVVALQFPEKRQTEVYSVEPDISRRLFRSHPHLRNDRVLLWEGKSFEALCLYRSDETWVDPADLTRSLDFTALFLAQHLVWKRTAALVCDQDSAKPRIVYTPDAGQDWVEMPIRGYSHDTCNGSHRWEGLWLGPTAPHEPSTLLRTVAGNGRCICGSGLAYAECCRPAHKATFSFPSRALSRATAFPVA